ncbi:unnamed protein product [Brassica rapa]|uniref:Replication factor A C-terminal domain-containing protein n=1 Tax=Brassica campestris TaxID=3711 RepID=A0A8D9LZ49_BRACM|nr:unnamed protein product [Brassica rapa]
MTSVLIKTYQGVICLSASSRTKFYLNHDFDSVTDFRKSVSYDGGCLVNLGDMVEIPSTNNEISDVQHSINDIWDFIASDIPQKKTFMCTATITNIVSHSGWNYISCSSCSTKLKKSETSLYCQKCVKSQSVGVLRIEVIVDDGNDSATFVIFDEDGSKITGATAEEIKRNSPEEGLKDIPKCVQSIVGQTYLFEIKIKERDFQSSYQSFTVSKIHKHIKSTPMDRNLENKRKEREEEDQKETTENLQKKPHT